MILLVHVWGEGAKRPALAKRFARSPASVFQLAMSSSLRFSFFSILGFQRLHKFVRLLLGLLSGNPVALLNSSDQLLAAPIDHVQVIVREFSPFFLGLTLHLLPFPFDLIPIHGQP